MSEENVEVVRAAVDAFNRGDLDAAFEPMAPDCEFDISRSVGLISGVYGLEQGRRLFEEFIQPWESVRFEAEEFVEVGECIVMPVTSHHRGRDGIEVQARTTQVWTFREGAVARFSLYQDREEALEAAGLRE